MNPAMDRQPKSARGRCFLGAPGVEHLLVGARDVGGAGQAGGLADPAMRHRDPVKPAR